MLETILICDVATHDIEDNTEIILSVFGKFMPYELSSHILVYNQPFTRRCLSNYMFLNVSLFGIYVLHNSYYVSVSIIISVFVNQMQ